MIIPLSCGGTIINRPSIEVVRVGDRLKGQRRGIYTIISVLTCKFSFKTTTEIFIAALEITRSADGTSLRPPPPTARLLSPRLFLCPPICHLGLI